MTYGTNKHFTESTQAWRIPLWLQMTFSGFILIFVYFLPETPRWLIANDRTEEALAVLTKYHGLGDRNNPFVELSYSEMKQEISTSGSDKRWWDYREMVNTRAARWRTTMVVSMAFFGQWSGNAAISYFMPVMVEQAGIDDQDTQLLLNGIMPVVSFVAALIGCSQVDRLGRRKMLFFASSMFVLWFSIIAALSAKFVGSGNTEASNAVSSCAPAAVCFY